MSKRKRDLFDDVMDTGLVGVGTVASAGLVGHIGKSVPGATSAKIMKGMEPMSLLPTMSATGGVFRQLNNMNKMVKKKRR